MPPSARQKAAADASMAATRLHLRLKTPFDRSVDVVTLAQKLGVWVAAQPLDSLYGFYLREPEGAGIVLNIKHPDTLQRFTCGHEIGHHVLGHESLTDVRESVTSFHGANLNVTELAAQSFAASLLMPLPIVNAVLRTFVRDRPLTASDVYVVSRELGVSYTAAIAQLRQLGKLTFEQAQQMSRQRPIALKGKLRGGRERVADARADVWLLGSEQDGAHLQCRAGDEIHLRLPEDLSRGLQWQLADGSSLASRLEQTGARQLVWNGEDAIQLLDAAPEIEREGIRSGLDVLVDEHVAAADLPQGDGSDAASILDEQDTRWPEFPEPGERHIILVAREPGRQVLRLMLAEPWIVDPAPAATYTVTLEVARTRRLDSAGVAQPQRQAHVRRQAAA
jgi:Zn-dependent peptidase ImmA (M78 family)